MKNIFLLGLVCASLFSFNYAAEASRKRLHEDDPTDARTSKRRPLDFNNPLHIPVDLSFGHFEKSTSTLPLNVTVIANESTVPLYTLILDANEKRYTVVTLYSFLADDQFYTQKIFFDKYRKKHPGPIQPPYNNRKITIDDTVVKKAKLAQLLGEKIIIDGETDEFGYIIEECFDILTPETLMRFLKENKVLEVTYADGTVQYFTEKCLYEKGFDKDPTITKKTYVS